MNLTTFLKSLKTPLTAYLLSLPWFLYFYLHVFKKWKSIYHTYADAEILSYKFDLTAFYDVFKAHGNPFMLTALNSALLLVLYYVFKIFILGGWLDAVDRPKFSLMRFFIQSKKHFWKLLEIKLIKGFIYLMGTFIVLYFFYNSLENTDGLNENQLALRLLPVFLLLGFLYTLLSTTFTLSQLLVLKNRRICNSFTKALKMSIQNKAFILFFMLYIGLGILFFSLYIFLEKSFETNTMLKLIGWLVLGQVLIFSNFARYHALLVSFKEIQNKLS